MGQERWAVIDCSKMPSESKCRMKMMCPENQMEDLIEASCSHACAKHGEKDSQELRIMLKKCVEIKEG